MQRQKIHSQHSRPTQPRNSAITWAKHQDGGCPKTVCLNTQRLSNFYIATWSSISSKTNALILPQVLRLKIQQFIMTYSQTSSQNPSPTSSTPRRDEFNFGHILQEDFTQYYQKLYTLSQPHPKDTTYTLKALWCICFSLHFPRRRATRKTPNLFFGLLRH